jgi:hypothetical protein
MTAIALIEISTGGQVVSVTEARPIATLEVSMPGTQGPEGPSAYDVAVENGFVGSEAAWLASLEGNPGPEGDSAYEVAVANGFVGTESAWLLSLKGDPGDEGPSAYDVAVSNGFIGNEAAWLASLEGDAGPEGQSAYEVAVANGFVGTESEWLASLEGPPGSLEGLTASHINTALGYTAANAADIPANTGELTEGSNLYFTAARVRSTVLTGLSTAAATIVNATHTVLEAIGFLQKQVSDNLTTLTTHTDNTSNPHSVTKTQVGLGNVDNTSDANKPVSTATQTALDAKVTGPASAVNDRVAFFDGITGKLIKDSGLTLSGTNTGNETTTTIGALVNGATDKATPVDADYVGLMDSAASNVLKKLSWANLKATLKTYFDTLYGNVTTTGTQTLTNKTLTNPTVTGYTETVYSLTGADINPANGTVQTKTLSGNTTFTESIADGQSVVLMLNPATFTTTWPTISWVNAAGSGAAPTLKASAMNVVVLWQVGGTLYGNWIGSL